MKNDTGLRLVDMRVDGGMTVNNLLMQIQVDRVEKLVGHWKD